MNERENTNVKKWYTVSEYVDIETGELLTKNEFINNYYKIRYEKSIEIREQYRNRILEQWGIIKYTNIGRKNRQTRLF